MSSSGDRLVCRWALGAAGPVLATVVRTSMVTIRNRWPNSRLVAVWNETAAPWELPEGVENRRAVWAERPTDGDATALWKWTPARVDPEAWEVWLDADMLVRNAEFLGGLSGPTISAGWQRRYGSWDELVPFALTVCAGLVMLPPGRDLAAEMTAKQRRCGLPVVAEHDEQGLVAACLATGPLTVLPMRTVVIAHPEGALNVVNRVPALIGAAAAVHLVGLRQWPDRHHGLQLCNL